MSDVVDTILKNGPLVVALAPVVGLIARAIRKRRAIASRSRISQLKEGPCSIVGRVVAEDAPMAAPGSGQPCVAWNLRITHPAADFPNPETVRKARPFWVEDESGRVLVDPNGALPLEEQHKVSGAPLTPEMRRLAQRELEAVRVGAFGNHQFKWSETTLRPGDRVLVEGHALDEIDPRGPTDLARRIPRRFVVRQTDAAPLRVAPL